MARFPVQTTLPGLSHVVVNCTEDGRAEFVDRSGNLWQLTCSEDLQGADPFLTIMINDGSMCSFSPWPGYPTYWMASGLLVNTQRQGIASAMYVCAKHVLATFGKRIAPSETVKEDGVAFWAYLDPTVKWEWVADQGCWRPDLTGLTPPP